MPISTRWYDDEHRVISHKFEGEWSWVELGRGLEEMATLAESVPYDLVLFTDMSGTNIAPKGNILAQGRSGVSNVPENITQIIIVIQSRLIEVFAGLIFDMIPKWRNRVRFVKTFAEGERLVAQALGVKATK